VSIVVTGRRSNGVALDGARFESLEAERKRIQTRTQELHAKRNALSKAIGAARGKGEDASALLAEVAGIGEETKRLEGELDRVQGAVRDFLLGVCRPAFPLKDGSRS
jgi:seryl-tRNA synthetase